ncbi:hypothetical protein F5144DRAFT_596883 [Chaetomium tenue]|uniref:Uncharacterized protein n=1 Tax=Chaetomium tenue TaxID=1854479 RepID=A0ACB7PKJ6_9PEZI|nr:hypothetical protein F5144DRAFT_596883 [Chaetomium globosum]
MKAVFTTMLATLATSVAAAPFSQSANTKAVTVTREHVNYILVLFKNSDVTVDPYQDEVDSVENPADVLG